MIKKKKKNKQIKPTPLGVYSSQDLFFALQGRFSVTELAYWFSFLFLVLRDFALHSLHIAKSVYWDPNPISSPYSKGYIT